MEISTAAHAFRSEAYFLITFVKKFNFPRSQVVALQIEVFSFSLRTSLHGQLPMAAQVYLTSLYLKIPVAV